MSIVLNDGRILMNSDEYEDWLQENGMSSLDVDAIMAKHRDQENWKEEYNSLLNKDEELEWSLDAYTTALQDLLDLSDNIKKMTKDKFQQEMRRIICEVI